MSTSPSLSTSKNATPPPMVSMRNRSGDSPPNCCQVIPACSVMSVKISLEAEAVAGMDAVFQTAMTNIRKTISVIVPALGIEVPVKASPHQSMNPLDARGLGLLLIAGMSPILVARRPCDSNAGIHARARNAPLCFRAAVLPPVRDAETQVSVSRRLTRSSPVQKKLPDSWYRLRSPGSVTARLEDRLGQRGSAASGHRQP